VRLTTGTRTRIVVDLSLDLDPAGATVAVDVDNDGEWHDATWLAPATLTDGLYYRAAQTVQFFVAGPVADPAGAVVLAPGRHFTTARVTLADGSVLIDPATIIDVVTETRFVSVDEFRERLANAGGAGSRTAAELDDDRLAEHLEEATGEVVGRIESAYTISATMTPPLVRMLILSIATYGATLEWNGSKPLEDRDPVNLAYQRALSMLERVATGKLTVEGITPAAGGSVTGEPATYGGVDVGLAAAADPRGGMLGGRHNYPAYFGGTTWE
jgi:phage gp36-like protein